MNEFWKNLLVGIGKVLYVVVSLIDKVVEFLIKKTKELLVKSFDEYSRTNEGVDGILNRARNILEEGLPEERPMKMTNDSFINKKLDHIIFFRSLVSDYTFPPNREKQIKSMENNIFNQLLAYSELEKGNIKAKVALIGGFSSGKSTIINSFLKEEICPSDPSPTTSSVTKFYSSGRRKITLWGKEISQQMYADSVRHKSLGKNTKTHFFEYGHDADIFNSIVLYDTPGFGNGQNDNDEKVTEEILEDVDVVIYTIDINKGSLDQEDMHRLNQLKKNKKKKFYCIMNKAEDKSFSGIEKIKEQIEKVGVFDMIIAYSAKKVLEASTHNSIEKFLDNTKKNIFDKKIFESIIKGENFKGRRNQENYRLYLGQQVVDDEGIDSIIQRWKLENIFADISKQKYQILENNFDENERVHKARAKNLLKDIVSEIDTYKTSQEISKFENELEQIFEKAERMERQRERSIKIIYINAYKSSLHIYKVGDTEKSYIFNPYYKISFVKRTFLNGIHEEAKIYKELISDVKIRLDKMEDMYDIKFTYPKIDDKYLFDKFSELTLFCDDVFVDRYFGYGYIEYFDNKEEAGERIGIVKKSIRTILNSEIEEYNLIVSEIRAINAKDIIQKSGMLKQNDANKTESKENIKQRIKDYIKGDTDA